MSIINKLTILISWENIDGISSVNVTDHNIAGWIQVFPFIVIDAEVYSRRLMPFRT